MERLSGAWLNRVNADREPWGTFWERESKTRSAARMVEEESAASSRLRHQAEMVNSFSELLGIAPENVGIPLTPVKFLELYRKIPAGLQNDLCEMGFLQRLNWGDKWQRSAFWRSGENAAVYFIDERNRIIRNITYSSGLDDAIKLYGATHQGKINDTPELAMETFPPERFFSLLFEWSTAEQRALIPEGNVLLSLRKPVTQVGIKISPDPAEYPVIAFESIGSEGYFYRTWPANYEMTRRLFQQINLGSLDEDSQLPDGLENADPVFEEDVTE